MRGCRLQFGLIVLGAHVAGCAQIAYAQTGLPQITVQAPLKLHHPKTKPPTTPATTAAAHSDAGVLTNGPTVTPTTAGPVSGYHALTAVTGTKTPTPIEQIPQSIIVLPRSVIDDQKPVTQDELFQNISDLSGMPVNSFYGINYKVRGFPAERFVDGLPNYNDGGDFMSTVNTERIEVIKGPGGLYYQGGLGVIGGVINTVSKLPTNTAQYQAGINIGNFDLYNPWLDVVQPLDPNNDVLFRMTGEFAHSRDFTDVIDRDSFSLNPTFTFDNHNGTTLTVQGTVSQLQQQNYGGLPAVGTLDTSLFAIRPNLYYGNPDLPKSPSDYEGITVRFDDEINSVWSFNVATRYKSSQLNLQAQTFFFNTPDVPPSDWAVFNFHVHDNNSDFSIAPNLIGKFDAGPTQNTVLLGADYDRVHADVYGWNALGGLVDLSNPGPAFPAYTDPTTGGTLVLDFLEHITNGGLMAQWQSTIFDRLHVLAGAREAYVGLDNDNMAPGTGPGSGPSYATTTTKLLPRFGAGYDIFRGVTVFAGYAEGLRGERYFTGPVVPKPEQSGQVESGLKLALPSGFTATLAVFDMTYRNVPTGDPTIPLVELQAGEERSKGFDADATWQPIAGLSILANYAYVDAKLVQDNFFAVGNRVEFTPENSGRLWANYKFQTGWLQNFSVGAGSYTSSRQWLDLTNQYATPAYTIFDGKIAYETKEWTLALTGKNLTNRQYYIPNSFLTLGRVAPGTPLTILASLTIRD